MVAPVTPIPSAEMQLQSDTSQQNSQALAQQQQQQAIARQQEIAQLAELTSAQTLLRASHRTTEQLQAQAKAQEQAVQRTQAEIAARALSAKPASNHSTTSSNSTTQTAATNFAQSMAMAAANSQSLSTSTTGSSTSASQALLHSAAATAAGGKGGPAAAPHGPNQRGKVGTVSQLFNTRGNLQTGQTTLLQEFALLREQQSKAVQQALTTSVNAQALQAPSLLLQLSVAAKVYEIFMRQYKRTGALELLSEAEKKGEGEENPQLTAAQQSMQLMCIAYLDLVFALIAQVRKHMELTRYLKKGKHGEKEQEEGDELNAVFSELDEGRFRAKKREESAQKQNHESLLL